MDYGIVAKMVQNDLCAQGLTAASLESAPLLVETFLKKINMTYNKDDVGIITTIMTSNVYEITPCEPGSAADGSDYDYDYDYDNTEAETEEFAEYCNDQANSVNFCCDELVQLHEYGTDNKNQLDDFIEILKSIEIRAPFLLEENGIKVDETVLEIAAVRAAISTIEIFIGQKFIPLLESLDANS